MTAVKVYPNDIFDYVVGNTNYDPLERCIDPTKFEVMDRFIYNRETKELLEQDETYVQFCEGVSELRRYAKILAPTDIQRICDELSELAPTEINLES